jgi:integrase
MAYLIRRGAFYYLNLRLPKHLFPSCHTLRLSLNVSARQTATFLATSLAQRVHEHLAEHPVTDVVTLTRMCKGWRDASPTTMHRSTPYVISSSPNQNAQGPTVESLIKAYLEEGKRGGTWRQVSTIEVERALRDMTELMGDMPIQAFDVKQARLLKDRLSRCPQYFALLPQFKGKALLEVVESGASFRAITAVTVNNRLRKMTAFMNWCKSNGYITENPLAGLKAMTAGSAKEARLSFDRIDLTALLDLEALHTESTNHPWRYWLPLLGRATGARLEELCQLHVDDFIEHQGIQCVRIDDRREGQNLKNSSSRRVLPLHPVLVSLGLLEHAAMVKAQGENRLFPDLQPVRGKLGHAPSKWFSRYKAKRGVTDHKKTFHSFRHLFIDDLRDAGVQDSLIKRMAGHEDAATSFKVYGSRMPMNAMYEALTHIEL